MSKAQEISELATQAGELVDNLKSLKERAENYTTATTALAEARAGLSKLIDETSRLAALTHQTLHKLDHLGATSILENLEALGSVQKQAWDQTREHNTQFQAHLARLEAAQSLNRKLTIGLVAGVIMLLGLTTLIMLKGR